MQILHVLHNKPSQVFELPDTKYKHLNMPHRPTLILAIKHQNIIGWDLFFKGYTSTYWIHVYNDLMQHAKKHNSQNWDVKFVGAAITLYKDIWDARNKHIHGQTKK
jgi:hypothetical protein